MDLGKERKIFGKLGSISLADIVQLLGVNKRTATLELDNDGERGAIFFKDGTVVHASNEDTEGEDAILHILEWPDASFVIEEGISTLPKVTMSGEAEALMLKLCSKLDELHRSQPDRHKARRKKRVRFSLSFNKEVERRKFSIPIVVGILVVIATVSVLISGLFLGKSQAPMAKTTTGETSPEPIENEELSGPLLEEDGDSSESASNDADPIPTEAASVTPSAENPRTPVLDRRVAAPDPEPPPRTTAPAPASFGFLLVVAEPWAAISIDGEKVGETPMDRIRLSAGEHTISLLNESFAGLITDRIAIRADETATRKYSFNEAGYLQVLVQPWADVLVDGRLVGQTPIQKVRIPVGRHTVTLRHPQLGEKATEIEIRLEETTLLRMEM